MEKIKSVESLRTFLESVPQSEVLKGENFWEEVKNQFTKDSGFVDFMNTAIDSDIDSITGEGFNSYLKGLLTEFINAWFFYRDNSSNKDFRFFPEDLMRVMYILLSIIKKQNTTIKNIMEIQNEKH